MTDTATTDIATAVDAHLAGYCEPDTATRAELLAQAWAPDGVLIDPPFEGQGHDGIAAMVDAVLQHYPEHRFVRTTAVDAHHGRARYGWELVGPDGTASVHGLDVARIDDQGRLVEVVGFFGDQTPAA